MDSNQGIVEETTVEVVEEEIIENVEPEVDSESLIVFGDDARTKKDDNSKNENDLDTNEDSELSRAKEKVKRC